MSHPASCCCSDTYSTSEETRSTFKTGAGLIPKIGLGIGAPFVATVVWGTFVAPGAAVPVPGALRLLLELVVFGSAVVALYTTAHPTIAWALGLAYAINRALMYVWDQ